MTTNTQAEEVLAKQIAEWRKEVARLNDLIAHAEGRDSQAASIDTPEFQALMNKMMGRLRTADITGYNLDVKAWGDSMREVVSHINAKLAQTQADADLRYKELAELHERTLDKLQESESRLAEIQRGVEGLQGYDKARILVAYADVIALLQPQGQADTSGLPG